ncbi:hypothetical protein [Phyllobacterium sp. P5_D12]
MPKTLIPATAEGLPTKTITADAVGRIQQEINGLTCMSKILADMLDEMTDGPVSPPDAYDLKMACFAWNDVVERAVRLEKTFDDATRKVEVQS